MFCPKCKSLMFLQDNIIVCNKCGYKTGKEGSTIVVNKQREKDVPIIEKEIDVLPKAKVSCPKCHHNEAFWVLKQTRSSDEPETRIFTCTKCQHRWRAY